jgi:hydroxypyruvate isomerase
MAFPLSVNLSLLFVDSPFLDRFERARRAGFDAVEFWWPSGEDLDALAAAVSDAGVTVALFNFDGGDMPNGDRGLLSDPGRQEAFRANVPVALELAERLGCPRLNALVGKAVPGCEREEQLALAATNLTWAAREAGRIGAQVLVEALNTFDNGPVLISRTEDAAALVDRAGEPNLALQYDAYHMERMEGDLPATIRRYADRIAHVQLADAPGRHEPGTGEIDFTAVFEALSDIEYGGYVGLEYVPAAGVEEGLVWLEDERFSRWAARGTRGGR